jgi:DNA anti-recombination protein RmuC
MNYPYIVTGIICFLIVYLFFKYRKSETARVYLPNLLTILGIFGTFLGIIIGLFSFKTSAIQESIPTLLEGLKTAFITSIFGIGASFILKFMHMTQQKKLAEKGERVTGASIDTLAELLMKLNNTISQVWENTDSKLSGIEKSLVGDGDTTLLTQLQKMRTSFADKQDVLINEFKKFAETMAEQNSKALIEALNDIIRDFNQKLTEQFGENFKQLNIAVGKLLEWQENYKEQLGEMKDQYEETTNGITTIKSAFENVVQKADTLLELSESLVKLVDGLDDKQKKIDDYLKEAITITNEAKKAIPLINDHIINATDKLTKSLNETSETVKESVDINLEAIKKQTDSLTENYATMSGGIDGIMTNVAENSQKLIEESNKILQEQIKNLDQQLQEELTKSLESLGSQLASLSAKFVSDYSPLTDKLKNIVELSKRIKVNE